MDEERNVLLTCFSAAVKRGFSSSLVAAKGVALGRWSRPKLCWSFLSLALLISCLKSTKISWQSKSSFAILHVATTSRNVQILVEGGRLDLLYSV